MKKPLKLIIALIIITNCFAFSEREIALMSYIYNKTKQFNYGYTLVAIAIKESNLGKYPINLQDPSCGLFHIMPSTLTTNKWKQSRICEALIDDVDFSISIALKRLKYFENYWRQKGLVGNKLWRATVGSYNGGFKSNYKYVNEIVEIIKKLKKQRIFDD